MDNVRFKRVNRTLREKFSHEGYTGFDLHFHTAYSLDGISRIQNLLKKAAKKGIGVAITDHNTIRGATACQSNRQKVPIIPGIEVTTKQGAHVLLYFYTHDELREFYTRHIMPCMKKNPFYAQVTIRELLEISKDYNCINSAAHPYAPGVVGIQHHRPDKKIVRMIDHIEALNGYITRRMNKKAIGWAMEVGKRPTAGSDGHSTSEMGKTLTFVPGTSTDEVLDAIKKGKTKIVGQEENVLKKVIMAIEKESLFIKRSHRTRQARMLIKNQIGNEYRYLKEKWQNRESRKRKHLKRRHLR